MEHMVGKLMTTGSQPDGRCHARSTGLGTIWVKTFGFETLRPLPQKYLRFIFWRQNVNKGGCVISRFDKFRNWY